MLRVFCSSITLRKEKPSIANLYSIIGTFEGRNLQITATNKEEKSAPSPRQCTVSQVDHNDSKTTWKLRIASAPSLFSRAGSQGLLAVCRPQKNAPGKEIWFQWKSDIGNWGVFSGQRQFVRQKKHRNDREAFQSVYHHRERLCR